MKRSLATSRIASLRLSGSAGLLLNGQAVALPTKRSLGILAMLALEGRVSRQKLAYTLWDEGNVSDPRRNLRQELYRLSKLPVGDLIAQDGEGVELRGLSCDVTDFENAVQREDWSATKDATGELLERFYIRDAPEFELWLGAQRARLNDLRATALEGLSARLEAAGELRGALELRLERLKLDEWNERDHRAAMRLLAQGGHVKQALAHFETFKTQLNRELNLEPNAETLALAARLRGETRPEREIKAFSVNRPTLEVAALLGDSFAWAELRGVAELPDEAISAELDEALAGGALTASDGGRFAFSDAALKTNLVDGLSAGRRRLLHLRLAQNLERLGAAPQEVALQLEGAGERVRAGGLRLRAAALARRAFDFAAALIHYRSAVALFSTPLEQLEGLRGAVQILELQAQLPERRAVIEEMQGVAQRSGEGMHLALLERARWELDSAQYAAALETAQDLLADKLLNSVDAALAEFVVGAALFRLGRMEEANTSFEYALKHTRKLSTERAGAAYHIAAIAFTTGRFKDAAAALSIAERVAEAIRHPVLQTNSLLLRAMLENSQGHSARALRAVSAALRTAQAGDLKAQQQAALQIRASIHCSQGNLASALSDAQAAFELPTTKYIEGVLLMTLANIQFQRGALGEGLQLTRQAIENADALDAPPLRVSRRALFAQTAMQCGDAAWAQTLCDEAIALAEPLGLVAQAARARLALGAMALRKAQCSAARRQLEELTFSDVESETERRIVWAQSCTALGDGAAVLEADAALEMRPATNLPPSIQDLRWTLEVVQARAQTNPDFDLDAALQPLIAALLSEDVATLDALEPRAALLSLQPAHAALRDRQSREIARLEANLPLHLRASFRALWSLEVIGAV